MPKVKSRESATLGTRYFVRFRLNGAQTTLTFPTEAEAGQFALDVEQRGAQWAWDNYQGDLEAAAEMTLDEWAGRYFAALTVSPATLDNYRRDWKRWQPHLGHMRLSKITREDIVAALKKQTGAPKTIANAWGPLASMLKVAVEDGHLDRSPARGVKLPRHEHHEKAEHRYLTGDEFSTLLADTPEHYQPLVWTLAGTGMRWSEATALTVADVDLEAATVRVNKAWKRDREKRTWYVGAPKSGNQQRSRSRRTITLPVEVADAIRPLVKGRKRKDLVFTNHRGEWVKHQTFYRETWRKHCIEHIPDPRPRPHDLRHSHVAWLIAAGVSLPVIQARLGHEKITTTIDTYGHLMPDLQLAAADAASRVLGTVKAIEG